jgi:hypothetical protein
MTAGLCGLLLLAASAATLAQSAPALTFSVNGANVTLNWTAVPGATGYQIVVAGVGTFPVPNVLSMTVPAPPGTYLVQVQGVAPGVAGPLSNQVSISVGVAPPAAPSPPTGFAALVNGTNALLVWTLPAGALSGLVIDVVGGPFAGLSLPLPVSTSRLVGGVPAGSHTLQIRATGPGGGSAPSDPLVLTLPGIPCGTSTPFPLTASSSYGFARVSWPELPGVVNYILDVTQNGAPVGSFPFPAGATTIGTFAGAGTYGLTLTANFPCGPVTGVASFVSSLDPPPGPRRPAGSVGIGQTTSEVQAAAHAITQQYPGDLPRSCGNHTWLFRVLQRLRQIDNRYGLNWKRGVVGSMSDDVIMYNFADVPDPQATAPHMYAWDVIGGHCGPSPVPQASYIGNPAGQARWAIMPYLEAGWTP